MANDKKKPAEDEEIKLSERFTYKTGELIIKMPDKKLDPKN